MESFSAALSFMLGAIVVALLAIAGASFAALLKGCFELRRSLRAASNDFLSVLLKSPLVPGVSVIYAAPDTSPESRARLRRLLDLHCGNHEVVLVLDGPMEPELDCWIQEFHLIPEVRTVIRSLPAAHVRGFYVSLDPVQLLVVDKEPGGESDALNAGVNAAQYPVLGLLDAESEFIPEVLLRLIRPMLADWEGCAAVCGVAPAPPAAGLAGRIDAIETLRLWLARGAAFSAWKRLVPLPGAAMLVKRETLAAVGGFRAGPLDLFLDLYAAARPSVAAQAIPAAQAGVSPNRVAFVSAAVCHRRAAGTWPAVRRHLERDQRQISTALRHRPPGTGREFLGLFCVRALRPLLETAGYVLAAAGLVTGAVPPALAGLLLVAGPGAAMVLSMAAVVLREIAEPSGLAPADLAALFLTAIPENLGYRQVRNLWLIAGFFAPSPQKQNRGPTVQDRAPAMASRKKE
jgi:hypothetical protein